MSSSSVNEYRCRMCTKKSLQQVTKNIEDNIHVDIILCQILQKNTLSINKKLYRICPANFYISYVILKMFHKIETLNWFMNSFDFL